MTSSQYQKARFWDRIAEKYARKPVADQAAYETKLEKTRGHLGPDMTVLEFGCGTGSTAIHHAPHVAHIDAIDISDAMLAIARDKAESAGITNVDFRQADMDSFDAPDGSYDAVLGLSILHLLDDRRGAIAKVNRLLKPDGVFISSTACIGDTMGYMRPILALGRRFGVFPYVDVFKQAQLISELKEGGFTILEQWQPGKGKGVFIIARKTQAVA